MNDGRSVTVQPSFPCRIISGRAKRKVQYLGENTVERRGTAGKGIVQPAFLCYTVTVIGKRSKSEG